MSLSMCQKQARCESYSEVFDFEVRESWLLRLWATFWGFRSKFIVINEDKAQEMMLGISWSIDNNESSYS